MKTAHVLFYIQDKSAQTWGDKSLLTDIGIVSSVIHVIDKESTLASDELINCFPDELIKSSLSSHIYCNRCQIYLRIIAE